MNSFMKRLLAATAAIPPEVLRGERGTARAGRYTMRPLRPLPWIHHPSSLPELHALSLRAWAALAHARRTQPSRSEWDVLDRQLRMAVSRFRRLAFPGNPEQASTSPATFASHFNVACLLLRDAAFSVEFALARAEGRVTDEWLLAEAPSSVWPTAWTVALEKALQARGLPGESGWPARVKAPDLTGYARCGPHVAEALHALYSVATPLLYSAMLERDGGSHPSHLLVARVDFAISDFDQPARNSREDMEVARRALPAFLTFREAVMSWATPSELLPLAERCMKALGVPRHLRGAPGPVP